MRRLLTVCVCALLATSATAQNRLASGSTYRTLELNTMPYAHWTSCVFWATCGSDPARLGTWTIESFDSKSTHNDGVQTNVSSRPVFQTNSLSFVTDDFSLLTTSLSEFDFLHSNRVYTIAAWVKFNDVTTKEKLYTLLSNTASSANRGLQWWHDTRVAVGTNVFYIILYSGVGTLMSLKVQNAVSDTNWHHWAATSDGSVSCAYTDGIIRLCQTNAGVVSGNSTYPLAMGRYQFSTPGGYHNGYMGDVRIHNACLSSNDIYTIYDTTKNKVRP